MSIKKNNKRSPFGDFIWTTMIDHIPLDKKNVISISYIEVAKNKPCSSADLFSVADTSLLLLRELVDGVRW